MKRRQLVCTLALVGSIAMWGSGCVAHAQAGAYGDAEAPVSFRSPPTLVEIDSDVWVVREHERAVYYGGGSYWVYRDGIWWRAQTYDGSWARVEATTVPPTIASRDHSAYVNYRGSATARTRPAPRENLASEPSPQRGRENNGSPPDHAAEQHGGPPGQNEVPGLGNQRKAEEGNKRVDKTDDKKDDKKEEKKEEKPADKRGGPKKK